jgi:hypothetical protein
MRTRLPRIVATPEVEREVRRRGGLLFVWPSSHRGGLTLLRTSTDPPEEALEYRRVDTGRMLVFLSPRLRRLPSKLEFAVKGWRRKRIAAYWDGCAFAI